MPYRSRTYVRILLYAASLVEVALTVRGRLLWVCIMAVSGLLFGLPLTLLVRSLLR